VREMHGSSLSESGENRVKDNLNKLVHKHG
jgi:hypothetical protein